MTNCILALCSRSFLTNVLIFTQTKKQAHRMHILLGLIGIKVFVIQYQLDTNDCLTTGGGTSW